MHSPGLFVGITLDLRIAFCLRQPSVIAEKRMVASLTDGPNHWKQKGKVENCKIAKIVPQLKHNGLKVQNTMASLKVQPFTPLNLHYPLTTQIKCYIQPLRRDMSIGSLVS